MEKSNKRLLRPSLYSKLPDRMVKYILYMRNEDVNDNVQQMMYESWLHNQGKRRQRVVERLKKKHSLLQSNAIQRASPKEGYMTNYSPGLRL